MKRILISGATGLIGTALDRKLTQAGHTVVRLTRNPTDPRDKRWDPMAEEIDPAALDGVDVVIHLAGENIGAGRWTGSTKRRLLESRVRGTRLLRRAIEEHSDRPSAFVSASGIDYYGDRGETPADESSDPGIGFLPDLCAAWEAEARTDATRSVRVRTAMVLTPDGGALKRMLLPSKLGLGGPIAGGRQWWSWVTLDDIVAIYMHLALTSSLDGPVNGVSPEPIRQRDFAATLGSVLHRPAFVPLPRFAVASVFGEMGLRLLIDSHPIVPQRLQQDGFTWQHPELGTALRSLLRLGP